MKRGVVVSTVNIDNDGRIEAKGGLSPEDIRFFLLYWDKIECPTSNIFFTGFGEGEDLLLKEGILQRTHQTVTPIGDVAHLCVESQLKTLSFLNEQNEKLKNKNKVIWTIGQTGSEFFIPDEKNEYYKGIEIDLYKTLPVPSKDVPLDEVLEFKIRHKDDLLLFRNLMDEFYDDASQAKDQFRSKTRAIEKIEEQINVIDEKLNLSWEKKFFASMKVRINLDKNALLQGLVGAGLASSVGIPLEIGGLIASASSMIRIKESHGIRINDTPRDYAYLRHIMKELK